jgi:hypothetical protein
LPGPASHPHPHPTQTTPPTLAHWQIIISRDAVLAADVTCKVWARLECVFGDYPFTVLSGIFAPLKHAHLCCLDAGFTEPFIHAFGRDGGGRHGNLLCHRPPPLPPPPPAPSPFSLSPGSKQGARSRLSGASLCRALLGKLRATNMHVEGLIAEFRQQSLQRKGRPNLELVHYLGLLGQVLKDFVADGNVHPLKQDTRSSSAADSQWPAKARSPESRFRICQPPVVDSRVTQFVC